MTNTLAAAAVLAIVLGPAGAALAQTPGVGAVRFANSGAPAAQEAFLTGLAQLHNFEYDAAAEWFRQAQQIDPGFAMAYWGEAMTYNHPVWMEQNISAARAVLRRLAPRADARAARAPTDRERAYVHAVETLYGEGDKYARDAAYADAMADLHRRYPDDVDGTAFYALALLGTAHAGRDTAIYTRAAALLEPLFPAHPNHPGIAHYLIHSYDDPDHARLGLPAARAYSKIAPNAAHAQHMCSHIFVAMGMWDDVVSANEAALTVVNTARAAHGLPPSACGHYPSWLEYGYLQQGRFPEAKALVASCLAAARRAPVPAAGGNAAVDADASAIGSFAAMRTRYLLDTEEWAGEVAGWTVPTAAPRAALLFAFTDGYLAVKTGHRPEAAASLDRLRLARQTLDASLAQAPPGDGTAIVARGWAQILEQELDALIAFAGGRADEAIDRLRAAAAAEDKLPYEFGPPFIDKPSSELLGEVLLAGNRRADAAEAFRHALARAPGRIASVRGLQAASKN